jgi:hypothetical protein
MYRVRLDALLCMRMDLVYVRQLDTTSQASAMARIATEQKYRSGSHAVGGYA